MLLRLTLQFSYKKRSGWKTYIGVRSAAEQPEALVDRGRSTEVYVKLSKQLRLRI